ncbi:hypothetical protein [Candidatus Bodocaedibacter vickermanii]|uniref:Uncharacterized protein n=1 Tax=Candidatus Bodocaedibacter vickermanii TaxID=2741701 RepID=A0A7L9RV04_9PROT|nr:hypothetical protein CPBP_01174 [Candidatus Paracaedibacteraceae bacterium 'Lake Konstanz']
MNKIKTTIIATILIGLSPTYSATLLFNDAQTLSDSSHNLNAHAAAINKAKKESKTSSEFFEYLTTTPQVTITHAYNFNFAQWYLNDDINLVELLSLAIALTSLQYSADTQPINTIWTTPLIRYNLDFSKALLALFE